MDDRIDQVVDMGLGAGLMFLFDPEQGKSRRQMIVNRITEGLSMAFGTVLQAGQEAGMAAAMAGQSARNAAMQAALGVSNSALRTSSVAMNAGSAVAQAAKETQHSALEAIVGAREAAMKAGSETLKAVKETEQNAVEAALGASQAALMAAGEAQMNARMRAMEAAAEASRRAREQAENVVPAAKAALLVKLAADERALQLAQKKLGGRRALGMRRGSWPWGVLLVSVGAAALGAAAMFLLDPQVGYRRRILMRDQFATTGRSANQVWHSVRARVANRTNGTMGWAEAETAVADTAAGSTAAASEMVADEVLAERVRATLTGLVSLPASLHVTAHDGHVTLSGPARVQEVEALVMRANAVPGVKSVENRLQVVTE